MTRRTGLVEAAAIPWARAVAGRVHDARDDGLSASHCLSGSDAPSYVFQDAHGHLHSIRGCSPQAARAVAASPQGTQPPAWLAAASCPACGSEVP